MTTVPCRQKLTTHMFFFCKKIIKKVKHTLKENVLPFGVHSHSDFILYSPGQP